MSINGETADLMAREGVQAAEGAVRLAGLGAKNLAAFLLALANDNKKIAGKADLKRLLQDGDQLTVFSVRKDDVPNFRREAKRYGVLYSLVENKAEDTGAVSATARFTTSATSMRSAFSIAAPRLDTLLINLAKSLRCFLHYAHGKQA